MSMIPVPVKGRVNGTVLFRESHDDIILHGTVFSNSFFQGSSMETGPVIIFDEEHGIVERGGSFRDKNDNGHPFNEACAVHETVPVTPLLKGLLP